MKALGIVAEYNPFHLGHKYHIEKSRHMFPEHGVVAVMSGDFVQRGQAAVFDKHSRAAAAVMGGADLVLELPLPWAVSSAEGFSRGAVGLLGALGVVDTLSFGSEEGSISPLEDIASALDSGRVHELTGQKLKSGAPYAAARQSALEEVIGENAKLISMPNNILGVEYIRAIHSLRLDMHTATVERMGAGHDEFTDGNIRSASQIRSLIQMGDSWQHFLPAEAYIVLKEKQPAELRLLECAMLSRLRMLSPEDIAKVPDCGEGLENRIFSAIRTEESIGGILSAVKTKRYALSRLRRILLCAALGVEKGMNEGIPPYARVLAANETGLKLLSEMKKKASIPLITKAAHGLELQGRAGECFRLTTKAREFYSLAVPGMAPDSDMRVSPFIYK